MPKPKPLPKPSKPQNLSCCPAPKAPPPSKPHPLPKMAASQANKSAKPTPARSVTKKGKQSQPKPQSIWSFLNNQSLTVNSFSTSSKQKKGGESVLDRPTARCRVEKARLAARNSSKKSKVGKKDVKNGDGKEATFPLMKLPKDVRIMIWKNAVVHPGFFIWPEQATGSEQPDLAMVSRQVREEVLPIFYRKNVFAVDVSAGREVKPVVKVVGGRKLGGNVAAQLPKSIEFVKRWANAIDGKGEEMGWFGMIRKWAFSYEPAPSRGALSRADEDDGSLIVSVNFSKKRNGIWDGGVEVHREARCILPGHREFGRCVLNKTPTWLNEAVIAVLNAGKGSSITGEMVVDLAMAIKERGRELVGARCEKVVESVEIAKRDSAMLSHGVEKGG